MTDVEALEQDLLMRITRYVHATMCCSMDMACFGMYQASCIPSHSDSLYVAYARDPVFAENIFAKHNLAIFDDYLLAIEEMRSRHERASLVASIPAVKASKRPSWL